MQELPSKTEYHAWLAGIKEQLHQSQLKASLSVNTELLRFYWYLGSEIVRLQTTAIWGTGFLKQLSKDLTDEFKGVEGFSERNLQYIRRFYERYSDYFSQQLVAKSGEESKQDETIWQQPVAKLKNTDKEGVIKFKKPVAPLPRLLTLQYVR